MQVEEILFTLNRKCHEGMEIKMENYSWVTNLSFFSFILFYAGWMSFYSHKTFRELLGEVKWEEKIVYWVDEKVERVWKFFGR